MYCKIVNNEVIEANIPERQVIARNDGGDYRKQINTVKPIEDENNKAVPVYTIEADRVVVNYTLQPRTAIEKTRFMNSIKLNRLKTLKENFITALSKGKMFSQTIQKEIDARTTDLTNIQSLIKILPDGMTLPFRCADNSFVEVTKEQLLQMEQEVIIYGKDLYQQKWILEQQIENATSLKDLRNLDLSFGVKNV